VQVSGKEKKREGDHHTTTHGGRGKPHPKQNNALFTLQPNAVRQTSDSPPCLAVAVDARTCRGRSRRWALDWVATPSFCPCGPSALPRGASACTPAGEFAKKKAFFNFSEPTIARQPKASTPVSAVCVPKNPPRHRIPSESPWPILGAVICLQLMSVKARPGADLVERSASCNHPRAALPIFSWFALARSGRPHTAAPSTAPWLPTDELFSLAPVHAQRPRMVAGLSGSPLPAHRIRTPRPAAFAVWSAPWVPRDIPFCPRVCKGTTGTH